MPSARLASLAARVPAPLRDRLRPLARRVGLAAAAGAWWEAITPHGAPPDAREERGPVWCNICRWVGPGFGGAFHAEAAVCPRCDSISRDRFLHWCFTTRTRSVAGARVLETSPRQGNAYRAMMRRNYAYRTSDFDLSAHTGDLQLDLQDIALPDASLDVVLSAHVLEHVPDTDRALRELHRVIRPGGRMYLQVPLLHGVTSVPSEPEFHGDNTPVFFVFGWDLTDRLRTAGFTTTVLVTDAYRRLLATPDPEPSHDGFDLASLVAHARAGDLTTVADVAQAALLGLAPPHHFATWECLRP